jgi:exonuclease SbcD
VLARDTWVAYAGSPQGLNPKETGEHGCLVVTVSAGGAIEVESVVTAPIGWMQLSVAASAAESVDEVRRLVEDACESARVDSAQAIVARVRVTGRTAVHAELARPGWLGELADSIRGEQASRAPWLWLDRLEDATSSPIDLTRVRAGSDFAAETVRISDELASDPTALDALLAEITGPVATTLGTAYEPASSPAQVLQRARDAALDLLLAEGGDAR